jgi:hypothetical protein
MTQIKSFDARNIRSLRNEYQEALDAVSRKYGFSAHMGRITFSSDEFRCKLTVSGPATIINATLSNPTLRNNAGIPGSEVLGSSYIGRSYKLRNSVYTITDMKSPGVLLAKNQNGRLFRIKVSQLDDMISI